MTLNGIDYTEKRLDYIGEHVAEELNVKAVKFWLDDGSLYVVEHDPMHKHYKSYLVKNA